MQTEVTVKMSSPDTDSEYLSAALHEWKISVCLCVCRGDSEDSGHQIAGGPGDWLGFLPVKPIRGLHFPAAIKHFTFKQSRPLKRHNTPGKV